MREDAMYMKLKGISKKDYEPAESEHICGLCEKLSKGYRKKFNSLPYVEDEELFICKRCYDELDDVKHSDSDN